MVGLLSSNDRDGWFATPRLSFAGILAVVTTAFLLNSDSVLAQAESCEKIIEREDAAAYREYLRQNRGSECASAVRQALRELDDRTSWREAKEKDTIAAYRAYLDLYPEGAFRADARNRIAELEHSPEGQDDTAWTAAKEKGTIEAYRAYIGSFPEGEHVQQARDAISRLEAAQLAARCREIVDEAEVSSLQEFLRTYPDAGCADEVREKLAELREQRERELEQQREREQEQRAWAKARSDNTIRAYEQFLEEYPNSRFSDRAMRRLSSLQANQQRRRSDRQTDRRAWHRAERQDTIASYREYVNAFPNGIFAYEARQIILERGGSRRFKYYENQDFYGSDLYHLEDVTLDRCKNACRQEERCKAFTYNRRANWCFLKNATPPLKRFEGAISGEVIE